MSTPTQSRPWPSNFTKAIKAADEIARTRRTHGRITVAKVGDAWTVSWIPVYTTGDRS